MKSESVCEGTRSLLWLVAEEDVDVDAGVSLKLWVNVCWKRREDRGRKIK